jgi:membrane protein
MTAWETSLVPPSPIFLPVDDPILMVSFAAAGFVLASHPTLLQDIFNKILNNVSDPTLASTLKSTINTAVQQRTTVGIVGLLIALYSGVNWMGNLREAIRAQSRDVWERKPQDQEKIWVKYLRDFVSLIGLLVALIVTLSITSVPGSAQQMIISALYLDYIEWLKPPGAALGWPFPSSPTTCCSSGSSGACRAIVRARRR